MNPRVRAKFFQKILILASSLLASGPSARAQLQLPSIPGLPALPQLTLPQVPGLPSSLPSFGLPVPAAMPKIAAPNFTGAIGNQDQANYPARENVFSLPDTRLEQLPNARPSYLEVINVPALQTAHQNNCRNETNTATCPQYEWSVPYSLESSSQTAAQGLRRAWQRFEDRYYWRSMTALNNPAYVMANCWLDWGAGLNPAQPETTIHLPDGVVEPSLQNKLPSSEPKTDLYLDQYWPIPQVENTDFCDGLDLDFTIMYIPGFCVSVMGADVVCTDNYPQPIWFNQDEAIRRVSGAILKAHTSYLSEYQADAVAAISPGNGLFPLAWNSFLPGEGAMVAPVMNSSLDPTPFTDLASQANTAIGGIVGANALPYYLQGAYRSPSLSLATGGLAANVDASKSRPGLWQLEEFKRLLKPSNPYSMERLGYATFFEAWNEMRTTVLPEPLWAKAVRPLVYWAVGVQIDISPECWACPIPVPAAVAVAPYLLPFVGPQMKWGWVSVPEGYEIPRVKDTPLYDYRPLLRTSGLSPQAIQARERPKPEGAALGSRQVPLLDQGGAAVGPRKGNE